MERQKKVFVSSLFLFLLVALLIFPPLSWRREKRETPLRFGQSRDQEEISFKAPKRNVWAELTEEEADGVYSFLIDKWVGLNITRSPASAYDNFIYNVEALRPNKTDVLPYFHGNHGEPERWAKVVLSRYLSESQTSLLTYYTVGPLPISENTTVMPLAFPFRPGRNYVSNPMIDFIGAQEFASNLLESISDITMTILGAKLDKENPGSSDSLLFLGRPERVEGGESIMWAQFFRPGTGSAARTLLPQGLYCKIHVAGLAAQWTVSKWFYNGVIYESAEHLRAAMSSPSFLQASPNRDGPWTDTEDFDATIDGREKPPPISVQPHGPRYKLDASERFVSWFGFEFYFTSTPATGISIYDIRFKGERVMYELSLQEALAHYAGDDPMAGGQEFLDTFFGMGTNAFELLPGYDCPQYADFLSTKIHRNGKTETRTNNVCLFEFTSDHLLSRHTAQYSVTASRNTFLTLRSVSTVGNYDYTIDYIFYLDGTIEVKVRASGFIYGAFHATHPNGTENEYGHRIQEGLSSSMHDHVIGFKADMDIAGTANDMVRLAVEPMSKSYEWDQPEVKQRNTMHLKEYPVEKETGLDWPRNSGELYIVYSASAKNAWGQRKGYRVVSGTGVGATPHLTVLNSTALGRSAKWAERDLWVVRHRDTEPRSADPLNYVNPWLPLVDFGTIADGESLDHLAVDADYDGDLVLYVNVGSHHVPHTGDIPNTLMHTSASSVMFTPHNFADRDPSRAAVQGVRFQLKGTKSGGFAGLDPDPDANGEDELKTRDNNGEPRYKMREGANYFGATYTEGVTLPLEDLEPDLEKSFHSREVGVTDLSYNGSATGMWVKTL